MFGIPIGELAILAAAVAGGGVVTGIMAGLFGIGGGAVIVPVLYEVFGALGVAEDIRMQLCIGTSLAIIVPTTFRSYFTHRSKNLGLNDVVRKWTVPSNAAAAFAIWPPVSRRQLRPSYPGPPRPGPGFGRRRVSVLASSSAVGR